MAPLSAILRHVHRLTADGGAESSDAALLARFARTRDDAAFEELLSRHGPLVWGVCTRLMNDRHAAEDAFQATFLVLARRAGSIRHSDSLASWLHGVARRVAGKLRRPPVAGFCEAGCPEAGLTEASDRHSTPLDHVTARELVGLLDEELGNLPERLRAPLVLCYLEGRTRDEAARALGWTLGTLKLRLEQARAGLRARLTRRGVSLSTALLTAALTGASASGAAVPALSINAVSATARAAADAVVRTMAAARLKVLAASVLVGMLAVGTGWAAIAGRRGFSPADPADPPNPAVAGQAAVVRTDAHGDPLPEGANARLGTTRFRGGRGFKSVAYSPDGKTLIAGSQTCDISIFDAESGRRLANVANRGRDGLFGHVQIVRALPDGRAIVASASPCLPGLWDLPTARLIRTFSPAGDQRVSGVAASADGRLVAVGQTGGPLTVFDVATGQERYQIEGLPVGQVWKAAFSGDGTVLATANVGRSMQVRVFDGLTGRERARLPESPANASHANLALAPSGKAVAWSSSGRTTVWDLDKDRKAYQWRQGSSDDSLAFSPDGTVLAIHTEYSPSSVIVWDLATGAERRWKGQTSMCNSLTFSPDGRRIAAAGGHDARIDVWDVANGRRVVADDACANPVGSVAFSPDGSLIAAAGEPAVRLWDAKTGREIRRLATPFDGVSAVAFAPDGRTVTAGGRRYLMGTPAGLRWWEVHSGREVGSLELPRDVYPLAFSPARDFAVLAAPGGRALSLWNAGAGLEGLGLPADGLSGVAATPDCRRVAANERGVPIVWDRDTGKARALAGTAREGGGEIHVAISPDGRTVAANSGESMGVWEVATGSPRRQFKQDGRVTAIALSPDGRTLAYAETPDGDTPADAWYEVIYLWDLAAERQTAQLTGHQGRVAALAFAPDGRTLVSGSYDTTALVWTVPPAPAVAAPADLAACWTDLAGADAEKGFTAHWQLSAAPGKTLPFLSERLRPASPPDATRRDEITRAIADLDSDTFAVRQAAAQRLARLGWMATASLKEALTKQPTAEAKRQIEQLLDRTAAGPAPGEDLQSVRAVEVLERIGSAEARRVLQTLATGAAEARLTREAAAAIDRLSKRPAP